MLQYSAVQYSTVGQTINISSSDVTVQCSTVQYSTVQDSIFLNIFVCENLKKIGEENLRTIFIISNERMKKYKF